MIEPREHQHDLTGTLAPPSSSSSRNRPSASRRGRRKKNPNSTIADPTAEDAADCGVVMIMGELKLGDDEQDTSTAPRRRRPKKSSSSSSSSRRAPSTTARRRHSEGQLKSAELIEEILQDSENCSLGDGNIGGGMKKRTLSENALDKLSELVVDELLENGLSDSDVDDKDEEISGTDDTHGSSSYTERRSSSVSSDGALDFCLTHGLLNEGDVKEAKAVARRRRSHDSYSHLKEMVGADGEDGSPAPTTSAKRQPIRKHHSDGALKMHAKLDAGSDDDLMAELANDMAAACDTKTQRRRFSGDATTLASNLLHELGPSHRLDELGSPNSEGARAG